MSPAGRIAVRSAAILAGLLLLVVLALPYLVSLDAMRARVAATAESVLHRKVEIGKMRLEILSGLGAGVEKVAVLNQPGFETPALVSADRVSIKVAFWPLLSRRVEVRAIVLDGATLAIERGPDGKLNVADFLSAGRRESAPASQSAAAALLVSRIEISRGRFLFVDRKVEPGKTVTTALDELNGHVADIGPATPARFGLEARFLADKGRNLKVEGSLGPPPATGPLGETPLDAAFSARGLALARLAPYVAAFRDADPGSLTASGKAVGKILGALDLALELALDPAGPSSPFPSVDGTFALNLDWTKGTLVVGRSLLDVAAFPLAFEGRIDALRGAPRVDLRLSTPADAAVDDVTGLPGVAGRFPDGVKLSGRARLDARIEGPFTDLETRATIEAAPFGVGWNGQPLFGAPSVHATLGSRGQSPLSGKVAAASGTLKSLPFENLVASWTWSRGALTLAPTAGVFGGTLGARIETDLSRPDSPSRLQLDANGIQARALLESTTSLRDVFSGALDGTLSLVSKGLSWDAVSKSASGDGRLSVTDADLRTVRLMPEVARTLAAVGKVAGFEVPPALESTKFSTLETSLALSDGRVSTPDLALSSRDVSVSAAGSIGLDTTLSYEGRVVLGAAVVKSLGAAGKSIADRDGRLPLPFRVSGRIDAPKVSIDESVVVDLGRRALARQAGERVGGAAGKLLGDALEGGDGRKADPADLLQRLLASPAPTPTPR